MLNYEFPPLGGGAANATRYLLEEFSHRDDLTVDLVTSSPDEDKTETFADNVTLYKLDVRKDAVHYWTQPEILRYSWKAYRKCKSLFVEKDYDLIHAWFGVPCGGIARLLGKPYLVALRGSDVPGYNERFEWHYVILKPVIRKIWTDSSAVIANSDGLRDLAHETADINIEVIPNGVAVDEFNPNYRERDSIQALCVSRLIKRKGIEYLIQAVHRVDNTTLVIVGEGNQEDHLQELVHTLGIDNRVTFTGYINHDRIHEYYESADLFVLPSFNEGMSNTLLEAMAAGHPVITTDTGGTDELVNENGIVVPKQDADAIATALRRYRDNPEVRRRHGEQSRNHAEIMSWQRVAEQYIKSYHTILDGA